MLVKLTGKHLCVGLFIIKLQAALLFSGEFFEIFKNTFFVEYATAASENIN